MSKYLFIPLLLALASCAPQPKPSAGAVSIERQVMQGFPHHEAGIEQGVSAAYGGVANNTLIIAGGCNFPETPAADGGAKRFYQGIYAAPLTTDSVLQWHPIGQLPVAAAYGASVPTADGLIWIGGQNAQGSLRQVWHVTLNKADGQARLDTLPSLPCTLNNMGAAMVEHHLYVVGGNADGQPSNRLLRMDITSPQKGWEEMPPMPGEPRVQPVCVAQCRDTKPTLYVWGGFAPAAPGRPASLQTSGYAFDPATRQWQAVATPLAADGTPISLGGGNGIAIGNDLILCTGGVDANIFLHALQREEQLQKAVQRNDPSTADSLRQAARAYMLQPAADYRFNRHLLLYHTPTDTWTIVGECEETARAGALLAGQDNVVYNVNGELKPGIRTPMITRIRVGK